MELVNLYLELGSYRAAAAQCRTTHKTVRRVIARWRAGKLNQARLRPPRARSTDGVRELIATRVKQSRGRISAQRLLPAARATGYSGSTRNLRRAVAAAKAAHRRQRRSYRP